MFIKTNDINKMNSIINMVFENVTFYKLVGVFRPNKNSFGMEILHEFPFAFKARIMGVSINYVMLFL